MLSWLRKKSHLNDPVEIAPTQSRVEIEVPKHANKAAVQKAKNASTDLNSLLVENGFTLKLYVATGGNHPAHAGRKK